MSAKTPKTELSLEDMLKAGVHFGHKTSKKHPKMDPYIFGSRNGVNIINLEKTEEQLQIALMTLKNLAANGKKILFLGTKRQAQTLVKSTAADVEMPYMTERWIGGLLTNYASVSGLMQKLTTLKEGRDNGDWEKRYNKKERLVLEREVIRLDRIVGGIEKMNSIPDALFVVDCKKEKTAIKEAATLGIPVIAMVDTNINPRDIKYPIPSNDDGVKSITYILGLVKAAVADGLKNPVAPVVAEKPKVKAESTEAVKAETKKAEEAAAAEAVKKGTQA